MVTAACFLFFLKLKWPKNKNLYEEENNIVWFGVLSLDSLITYGLPNAIFKLFKPRKEIYTCKPKVHSSMIERLASLYWLFHLKMDKFKLWLMLLTYDFKKVSRLFSLFMLWYILLWYILDWMVLDSTTLQNSETMEKHPPVLFFLFSPHSSHGISVICALTNNAA